MNRFLTVVDRSATAADPTTPDLPDSKSKGKEFLMSYRMQHGHVAAALATEDERQRAESARHRLDRAVAEYRRSGEVPDNLPAALLEQFTTRVFLARSIAEERRKKVQRHHREERRLAERTKRLKRQVERLIPRGRQR